ncbi:hypothetical protein SAMN05428985_102697 [Nocardioides sp. YR527]|uniref:hypothetical protein n=1 Tax=Nocardioides sp. YR527 TaxID=1881028 RepID=UPI000886AB30|nr:hypothetical protein [Nocardioides sp. YR527]SDK10709.1 hypothetical protein SAMN05428985_102697 [Nocardioides sp. YR527]
MRAHELTWALGLLESVSDVEVLSIRVDTFHLTGPWVECIEIDVHAESWSAAGVLVEELRLQEDHDASRLHTYDSGTYGEVVKRFRTWRGWSADASQTAPVSIKVTAAEVVPSEIPEPVAA